MPIGNITSSLPQWRKHEAQELSFRSHIQGYYVSAENPAPWVDLTHDKGNDTRFGCLAFARVTFQFDQPGPYAPNDSSQNTQFPVPDFTGFVISALTRSNNSHDCSAYTSGTAIAWPNMTCGEASRPANIVVQQGSLNVSALVGNTPLASCLAALAGGYAFVPGLDAKTPSISLSNHDVAVVVVSLVIVAVFVGAIIHCCSKRAGGYSYLPNRMLLVNCLDC